MSLGKVKAKDVSLIGQIIASIWVAVWCSLKFKATGIANITVSDIIFSGAGEAMCYSPVYFGIIMDKVKNIRFGDTPECTKEVPEANITSNTIQEN